MSDYFYAKVDHNNIVVGINAPAGPIVDATMIQIGSYDKTLMGKKWNGASFEDVAAPVNTDPVVNISLTAVGGAGLLDSEPDFSKLRATEQGAVTISAAVPLPDATQLTIPMARIDNGFTIYVSAVVNAGVANFSFSFPSSGRWVCTQNMLNDEWGAGINFQFAGVTATVIAA